MEQKGFLRNFEENQMQESKKSDLTSKKKKKKIILGIDPGTNIMGYGIIQVLQNKPLLLDLGIIKLNSADDHTLKLRQIFSEVTKLIEKYLPDEFAIEAPFFGKNVQSMLKLGRAQGVAIAAAVSRDLPVFEYSPRKIKQSITGKGSASKEQVASMLGSILHNTEKEAFLDKKLDATDALAAAVCHFFQNHRTGAPAKTSSWEAFIKANPNRKI